MNRNYAIGAADERAVRAHAESVGCVVVRAAGSHGTDLVVVDHGVTIALNVKRNRWAGPAERAEMWELWNDKALPVLVRITAGPGRPRRYAYREVERGGALGPPTREPPWEW